MKLKTNKKTATWISGLLMTGLLIFPGCYPDWPEHSGNAVVHGQVTLDGAPVLEAKVAFIPVQIKSPAGRVMPVAYGITNADGEFELQYADKTKELIAGTYVVIISKTVKPEVIWTRLGRSSAGYAEVRVRNELPWPEQYMPPAFMNSPLYGNQELIPTAFNRESTLTCRVLASPSIFRPTFDLKSVDPLLK